jgi:hypothetical protein
MLREPDSLFADLLGLVVHFKRKAGPWESVPNGAPTCLVHCFHGSVPSSAATEIVPLLCLRTNATPLPPDGLLFVGLVQTRSLGPSASKSSRTRWGFVMCARACVWTYSFCVCVCVHMVVYVCACRCVLVSVCLCVQLCVCLLVRVVVCAWSCSSVCVFVHMLVCMYVYVNVCVVCVFCMFLMHACMCMCMCMCMCIFFARVCMYM